MPGAASTQKLRVRRGSCHRAHSSHSAPPVNSRQQGQATMRATRNLFGVLTDTHHQNIEAVAFIHGHQSRQDASAAKEQPRHTAKLQGSQPGQEPFGVSARLLGQETRERATRIPAGRGSSPSFHALGQTWESTPSERLAGARTGHLRQYLSEGLARRSRVFELLGIAALRLLLWMCIWALRPVVRAAPGTKLDLQVY